MTPKIVLTADQYDAEKQAWLTAGEKTGFQKACDFIAVMLNDPEIMGSRALSGDKIDAVFSAAVKMSDEYHSAFLSVHNVEADVWQERLDSHMRRIFKDKFDPFSVRYPYVKKVRYGKQPKKKQR